MYNLDTRLLCDIYLLRNLNISRRNARLLRLDCGYLCVYFKYTNGTRIVTDKSRSSRPFEILKFPRNSLPNVFIKFSNVRKT